MGRGVWKDEEGWVLVVHRDTFSWWLPGEMVGGNVCDVSLDCPSRTGRGSSRGDSSDREGRVGGIGVCHVLCIKPGGRPGIEGGVIERPPYIGVYNTMLWDQLV